MDWLNLAAATSLAASVTAWVMSASNRVRLGTIGLGEKTRDPLQKEKLVQMRWAFRALLVVAVLWIGCAIMVGYGAWQNRWGAAGMAMAGLIGNTGVAGYMMAVWKESRR